MTQPYPTPGLSSPVITTKSSLEAMPKSHNKLPQSYTELMAWLNALDSSAIKLGLARIKKTLDLLNNPQKKLRCIHIAGTNGKGSVAAMLNSVLLASGKTVGLFTSPHLIDVRERIVMNGKITSESQWLDTARPIIQQLQQSVPREDWPTYFEFITVLAFSMYEAAGLDWVVLETGLGGRLDSTNCIEKPALSIITSIGFDHQRHLGNTLAEIAGEKAGIIKPGCPVVIGSPMPKEALDVLQWVANAKQSPVAFKPTARLIPCAEKTQKLLKASEASDRLPLSGQWVRDVTTNTRYQLALLGEYQCSNAATVLTSVEILNTLNTMGLNTMGANISEAAVKTGLATVTWPGRMQYIQAHNLIVDGSHNADGFNALHQSLKTICIENTFSEQRKLIGCFSLKKNREMGLILTLIQKLNRDIGFSALVFLTGTPPETYHSAAALKAEILNTIPLPESVLVLAEDTVQGALAQIQHCQKEAEAISAIPPLALVTGSLYTAGDVLKALNIDTLSI
ncbi:MAG: folylpolyglutamate synthase/dihydrofolate synthase family protein [Cyanobacteria bacterium P01_H01_bin.74]